MARKKTREVVADPPPTEAPAEGSVAQELEEVMPLIREEGAAPEQPTKRTRKKKEPEPPEPSPWAPMAPLMRGVMEPLYRGFGVECPPEILWTLWCEQGGRCIEYYVPNFSDHPLPMFAISTIILVSPIMAKVIESRVKPGPGTVRVRSERDGQNDPSKVVDFRSTPHPGA